MCITTFSETAMTKVKSLTNLLAFLQMFTIWECATYFIISFGKNKEIWKEKLGWLRSWLRSGEGESEREPFLDVSKTSGYNTNLNYGQFSLPTIFCTSSLNPNRRRELPPIRRLLNLVTVGAHVRRAFPKGILEENM